jgi:homoserine O-acetyltransferase
MIMKAIADITALNITTPEYRVIHTKPEDFPSFIKDSQKNFSKLFNVYNWRSQLKAIILHDVSAPFNEDMKTAAARVKAKMLIIISLQDHMVNPAPAINFAGTIKAQIFKLNNDCGHLAPGCEIVKVNKVVNQFLDK